MSRSKVPIAIAIDFGGTHIKGALVSKEGTILLEDTRLSDTKEGPDAVTLRMSQLILDLSRASASKPVGVGLGCPGPLSIRHGTVYGSPNLPGWDAVPIVSILSQSTGLPVFLDNDANCAVLGESKFGVAQGKKHVVLLTFGTGIGGGVLVNGQLLHGAQDGAAELGHFVISRDGPKCACGIAGCFEAHCSASAVARRTREALSVDQNSALAQIPSPTAKDVSEAAAKGDRVALLIIRETAFDLARGVGGLVNIFNPEMVVLAGGLMRGGQLYIELVRQYTAQFCFPYLFKELAIELTSLKDRAGILGAAELVFQGSIESN